MKNTIEFTKKYLDFMDINKVSFPSLDFLSYLQVKHIETFSWNTIDLFLGRAIRLAPQEILDKFSSEQKGGVCYELNGAFCYLLNQLGFDAYLASAYVHGYNNDVFNFNIDTHVVIIVKFSKEMYLVDVGWGDSYKAPILLKNQTYFSDISGKYCLFLKEDTYKFQLEKFFNGEWKKQYDFSLTPSELTDFYPNLDIIYKDPAHQIHRQLTCIKPNSNGYIAIKNDEFIVAINNCIEKYLLNIFGGIQTILKEKFHVHESFINAYFQ